MQRKPKFKKPARKKKPAGKPNETPTEYRLKLPKKDENEMFAQVTQLCGSNQIKAMCDDSVERSCRIPGKLRKRVWLRTEDIIIVRLWDIEPAKADVTWRYLKPQVAQLQRKGLLKNFVIL